MHVLSNSVLMDYQCKKTGFLIEVLIHDDASTEGTDESIKEYEATHPEIIKPLYERENQLIKGRRGLAILGNVQIGNSASIVNNAMILPV